MAPEQGPGTSCTPAGGAIHTFVCRIGDPGIAWPTTCAATEHSSTHENFVSQGVKAEGPSELLRCEWEVRQKLGPEKVTLEKGLEGLRGNNIFST